MTEIKRGARAPLPKEALKQDYDDGLSFKQLAEKYELKEGSIRALASSCGWQRQRSARLSVDVPQLDKSRLGIRGPMNQRFILEAVLNGTDATRAAMACGIREKELIIWRRDDIDFDLKIEACRSLYLMSLEESIGAAIADNPTLALSVLERVKETRKDYSKQNDNAPLISLNFGWGREDQEAIDVTPTHPLLEKK